MGRNTPDFIVRLDDGHGPDDPLNLIVEVTGEKDKDKEAKTATAQNLWVPAVNNAGTWGRWAFVEVDDPWDATGSILGTGSDWSDQSDKSDRSGQSDQPPGRRGATREP